MALWWTIARLFTAHPHPVLMLALADYYGSLARHIHVLAWQGPYCCERAAEERARANKFRCEATSLRAQQQRGRARRRSAQGYPTTKEKV
ncbi:hypothetical protein ACIRPX_43165 [Streptomyces sp. NPDC101225]|uniref:hypothetical protein n=1 Tax=Streptomyces sp. NPDC101225 TaxID=3366135 RepID=UPI003812EEFD